MAIAIRKNWRNCKSRLKEQEGGISSLVARVYIEHFRWFLSEAVQELADLDHKLEQVDKRLAKQLQPHSDLILACIPFLVWIQRPLP